jgi:hypothetical protein
VCVVAKVCVGYTGYLKDKVTAVFYRRSWVAAGILRRVRMRCSSSLADKGLGTLQR